MRSAKTRMDRLWAELTGSQPAEPLVLEVKGRKLAVALAAMGVARFTFAELCEQPLGTLDYPALAHKFHTVMIDEIPVLAPARREVARRFVNLIDTLYDNRVGLVASAAAEPADLYPGGGRTISVRAHGLPPDRDALAGLSGRPQRAAAGICAHLRGALALDCIGTVMFSTTHSGAIQASNCHLPCSATSRRPFPVRIAPSLVVLSRLFRRPPRPA